MTKTPTTTPTVTPTNTMTPTPTETLKQSYYAYKICGKRPSRETVIIQDVPAIPGNVVGNVILDLVNKICWELVAISTDLGQLLVTWNGTHYSPIYFTNVYGTIFTGSDLAKPCEDCEKLLEAIGGGGVIASDCKIDLRNWSDCVKADTTGKILINGEAIYVFDETFDANVYLSTLYVNNGDIIQISLYAPVDSTITLYTELSTGVNTYTIEGDNERVIEFRVECGTRPQKIDIFSTCNREIVCTEYSTDGSDTVYYTDCFGDIQIIDIGNVINFCAADGAVTGNGVSIIGFC
jgi:hypothetical protein